MHKVISVFLLFPFACHAAVECEGAPITVGHFIVAETQLSGSPARLALDPIRNVLLDRQFARATGLEVLSARQVGYAGSVRIGGAGAEEQEPGFAVGLKLDAGGVVRDLQPVVVVDLRGPLGSSFEQIDGLLGTDLFDAHVLDIDIRSGCLSFIPREQFRAPAEQPLTVERRNNRPVIAGVMEFADGQRHELTFLLDFGMSGSVRLSTRFVDEHNLDENLMTTEPESQETGLGGKLRSLETTAALVELGASRWQDLAVRLARETEGADANPPWDALIGIGLLKTRHLIYDPAGDRFWMLSLDR